MRLALLSFGALSLLALLVYVLVARDHHQPARLSGARSPQAPEAALKKAKPSAPPGLAKASARALPVPAQPLPSSVVSPEPFAELPVTREPNPAERADHFVNLEWEERLSRKPPRVVAFFNQVSATYDEWADAYREDLCACLDFQCITALQDDFVSRAPQVADRLTARGDAAVRAGLSCASRLQPTLVLGEATGASNLP